jgi:hypothetical protein
MARVPVDDFVVKNIGGYLQVLPNTPVQVNIRGGAGATLYSDAAGTPKPNPFNSDADGHFSFWVDEGSYTIVASPAGGGTITLEWEAAKGAGGTGSGWPGTYPAVAADISDGAVGTTELADLSVTSGKIADGSIIGTKLGASSVGTTNITDLSVTTAKIQDNAVVNSKIAAGAAIAWTKINKTGSSLADFTTKSAADLTSGTLDNARLAAVPYSALALAGGIVDADVSATAALGWSKISKTGSSLADLATRSAGALNSGTLPNARLVAVPYTALSLAGSIVDADVSALAAIGWTKIDKTGSSLADLATRSASDLTTGTLAAGRLPGAVVLTTETAVVSDAMLSGGISAGKLAPGTDGYTLQTVAGVVAWAPVAGGGTYPGGYPITNADVSATAAIAWAKVDKTGSSLADFDTRSASDLATGTLAVARLPGVVVLTTDNGIITTTMLVNGAVTNAKIAAGTIMNGVIAPTAAIDWTKVSKTGSSLADLVTRSAAHLTSGTLDVARLPATVVQTTDVGSIATGMIADLSITTAKIAASAVTDAKVSATAAIGWTKIDKTGSSLSDLVNRSATDLTSGTLAVARLPASVVETTDTGSVTNTMLAGSIAVSKLAPSATNGFVIQTVAGVPTWAAAPSGYAGSYPIVNADISATAAIAYSKLALTGSITNADVNATAAIAYSKLSLAGSIVNADISATAAIAYSKLALTGSIVNADIGAAAAIGWTKVSKTGSSLADLATRSASDLSTGTIPAARLPVFGASGASHSIGAVPDPGSLAAAYRFLREDGVWESGGAQVIDIRKYGAIDGAANNTTAVNAAFAAAQPGQTVYFPSGTWTCTGDIIPKDGVHWRGEGSTRDSGFGSIVNGRVNWGTTDFIGHCDIKGIHFTNTTGANTGQCWLWQSQVVHITVDHCSFIGDVIGTANMIHCDRGWVVGAFTCEPIRFTNCYFRNGWSAFYYKARNAGEFSKFAFENCRFDNFRWTALVIDTGFLKSGTLHNLTFEGFGNAGATSIKIYSQMYGLTMSDIYTEGTCSVTAGLIDVDIRGALSQTSPGDGSASDVQVTNGVSGSWTGGMLLDGTTLPSSATKCVRFGAFFPGFIIEGVGVNKVSGTYSYELGQNVSANGCGFSASNSAYVATTVKAGTPADADFVTVGPGAMVVDTSANKLWVRMAAGWKSAALV